MSNSISKLDLITSLNLFLIGGFPTHNTIRNRIVSIAIQEFENLYYKEMKTGIIVISPSCVNCKRTKS